MSLSVWNLKKGEWRTAAWLLGALALGLALLLFRPTGASGDPSTSTGAASVPASSGDPLLAQEQQMDASLEAALEAIQGAGKVIVQVHLAAGPRTDYAENVQASTTGSGDQQTSGTNAQLASGSGGAPLVQGIQAATVSGVLVIAAGASNPQVALELTSAVAAATGAPLYTIDVVGAEGGEPHD